MAGRYQSEEEMKKYQGGYYQEPVVGIPYGYPPSAPGQGSGGYPAVQPAYPPGQGSGGYPAGQPAYAPGQGSGVYPSGQVAYAPGQGSGGYPAGQPTYPPQAGQPTYAQPVMQPPPQQQAAVYGYHPNSNPYQAGMIPPNAIYGPPNGVPLRETFFADTPAPFECPHCGKSGLTRVNSSPSLAACVACMVSLVGVCFLCKGCDCLWNKQHYCQNCGEKVAEFNKSDPCMVMDPPQWQQVSFAIPA